ncbi:MAG: hypothetical protein HHJ14_02815 [Cellulomonas sp.]|nr:hypothetical protein [Cellulomonas sp.]
MSKSTNRRKSIAIALAVLGVAGLSLASAAQLNLTQTNSVQSASLALNADCQGTAAITVTFAPPARAGGAYFSNNVTLSGIDSGCFDKKYKLALLDKDGLVVGTEQAPATTISASTLTYPLTVGQDTIVRTVALTIYS